jgi:hypothetical protein
MMIDSEWIRHNDEFVNYTQIPERHRVTMTRPVDSHSMEHKHRVHRMVADVCTEIKLNKLMRHNKKLLFKDISSIREGTSILYENGFSHVQILGTPQLQYGMMVERISMPIDLYMRNDMIVPCADAVEVIHGTRNTEKWGTEVIGVMIGENAVREYNEWAGEQFGQGMYSYDWYYGYDIIFPDGVLLLTTQTRQRIGKI